MSVPVVAFFNNKGGVGKTSLVYHLAWMYRDMGYNVLVADLDPQGNLTAAFLDDDRLEELWPDSSHPLTLYGAVEPLLSGTGDILADPHAEPVDERLHLLVGDLALTGLEQDLALQWPACLDGNPRAFRVESAFWRTVQRAAERTQAGFALVDLGPNLGAINRAALLAADYLVVPLAPDLFSLQGLKNLGPTVRRWRGEWHERRPRSPTGNLPLPEGRIEAAGYIVMQHAERLGRPVKAYLRWAERIPIAYATEVLGEATGAGATGGEDRRLGLIKHYRSLMPLAQEARKPMFRLQSADGAIGAHAQAVAEARRDFRALAEAIARRCKLPGPERR